jgi:hypothetical protein
MERIASCTCGQLNARCMGEPVRISVCHCFECQRRTGSAFSVQATYREADVILGGSPSAYTHHGLMTGTLSPARLSVDFKPWRLTPQAFGETRRMQQGVGRSGPQSDCG